MYRMTMIDWLIGCRCRLKSVILFSGAENCESVLEYLCSKGDHIMISVADLFLSKHV